MPTQKPKIELWDFYADWCAPCQIMNPLLEELEEELKGKVTFKKINVDQDNQTAAQYNIMSIPTFLIFKDGKVVDQLIGVQSKEVLLKKLRS